MLIKVTEEDIRCGIKEDCERCPIARAIWRTLCDKGEKPYVVNVDGNEITYTLHDDYLEDHKWRTPRSAEDFIAAFDDGVIVSPFEFELDPKDEKFDGGF